MTQQQPAQEIERRPTFTWRCDRCGAEFDFFTYGGPCPGKLGLTPEEDAPYCGGELHRKKVKHDR